MAKNFEEALMNNKIDTFIKKSNAHGEEANTLFGEVIAWTIRIGNLDALNRLYNSLDYAGDRAAFAQGIDTLNAKGLVLLFSGNDEATNIIKSSDGINERGRISVFRYTEKDKLFSLGDSIAAKAFRRQLRDYHPDDEDMSVALQVIFTQSNEDLKKKTNNSLNSADYLKKVVNTILNREDNLEQAKSLAIDLNKVIKAHFGKAKAIDDSVIVNTVKEREGKEGEELAKAREALIKAGYDVAAPKPSVVINHEEQPDNGKTKAIEQIPHKGREGEKKTA